MKHTLNSPYDIKVRNFLQAYFTNGFNAREAAKVIGLSEKSGYSFLRSPKVMKALREYFEKDDKRYKINRDVIAHEYDIAISRALELDQLSAAVSAIKAKAKLFGYDINTVVHEGNSSLKPDSMKMELEERIQQLIEVNKNEESSKNAKVDAQDLGAEQKEEKEEKQKKECNNKKNKKKISKINTEEIMKQLEEMDFMK